MDALTNGQFTGCVSRPNFPRQRPRTLRGGKLEAPGISGLSAAWEKIAAAFEAYLHSLSTVSLSHLPLRFDSLDLRLQGCGVTEPRARRERFARYDRRDD